MPVESASFLSKLWATMLGKLLLSVFTIAVIVGLVFVVGSASGSNDDGALPDPTATPEPNPTATPPPAADPVDPDDDDAGTDPGGSGASGTGDGGSGDEGDNGDGGGSGSGGSGIGTPGIPGPGGVCGPEEFLGGLIPFVMALGNPDLLPGPAKDSTTIPLFPSGPVLGPIGGALAVPANLLGGFNDAYGPIADLLPPDCGQVRGDPHIDTLDGLRYDFQAVGEYWAMRNRDASLAIQIRTEPIGASNRASVATGVAALVDGHVVVLDTSADAMVVVDGDPVDGEQAFSTPAGGAIVVLDEGVAVYWPDGETTLTVTGQASGTLWVLVTVGDEIGDVSGLLGNNDGDPTNDLALADGTVVGDDFDVIYGPFREAWRVSDDDMLFAGPSAYRADYPNTQTEVDAGSGDARLRCVAAGVVIGELLDNCIYDLVVSGDEALADTYALHQRNRYALLQDGCVLDLDGAVSTAGFSPDRTWMVDGTTIGTTEQWTLELDDDVASNVSTVLPVGDLIAVVDVDAGLIFVDADGAVVQTIPVSPRAGVEPLVVGQTVFVVTEEGLAATGIDGQICWHLLLHHDEEIVSLGWANNMIVATTESANHTVSVALAVDPRSGAELWNRPLQANVRQFGAAVAPVITADMAIFEGADGGTIALDLGTGDVVWTYESAQISDSLRSIALVGDIVVVTGRGTGATALDAASGEAIWNVPVTQSVAKEFIVGTEVAVMVSARGLVGVDPATGEVLWQRDDINNVSGAPHAVVVGDQTIVSTSQRALAVISLDTGETLDVIESDRGSLSSNANQHFTQIVLPWNDLLLVIDNAGVLVAYS